MVCEHEGTDKHEHGLAWLTIDFGLLTFDGLAVET
jgi:hypothetical protein